MLRALLPGLLSIAIVPSALAAPAPCIDANASCTEWISLGGASRSLMYRTLPLTTRNDAVTRAMIMVHGAGRDADHYFTTAVAAAFLGRALEDTLVVSPRFASNDANCHDTLAPNEVSWPCNGDSWRSGGKATNGPNVSSFDLMDILLTQIARKDLFPNLKVIVVTGHSAGGQYVNRYEMANKIHETIGVPIRYIVANPSSYAYLDARRPALDTGNVCVSCPSAKAGAVKPYTDQSCTGYDQWPYGLNHRTGYTAAISEDQLKKQLAARPTAYLLGEIDILPLGGFDSGCAAMAQGPTRRARGEAFVKYVNENYGAKHTVSIVSLCGHNARCMYTADPSVGLLFPKP